MAENQRPRGTLIRGAPAIARAIFGTDDARSCRMIYLPDIQKQFGIFRLRGKLAGYSGWIEGAIERKRTRAFGSDEAAA
jgi:hypothetical protein